jgi:hypothetical protein
MCPNLTSRIECQFETLQTTCSNHQQHLQYVPYDVFKRASQNSVFMRNAWRRAACTCRPVILQPVAQRSVAAVQLPQPSPQRGVPC